MQHKGIEYEGKIWKDESEVSEAFKNRTIDEFTYGTIMERLQTEQWKTEIEGAFALSDLVTANMTEENIYLIWTTLDKARMYEKCADEFWKLKTWIQNMPKID